MPQFVPEISRRDHLAAVLERLDCRGLHVEAPGDQRVGVGLDQTGTVDGHVAFIGEANRRQEDSRLPARQRSVPVSWMPSSVAGAYPGNSPSNR